MDAKIARVQKLANDPVFVSEMKEVFFEAMLAGYASAGKIAKVSIAELPGSKMALPYVKGPWEVSDPYLVNVPLSPYSGGTTIIAYECIPVWMMQYFGWYVADAIPFLKSALRSAYEKKLFLGGRGPIDFEDGEWVYSNLPSRRGFEAFDGFESISKGKHTKMGEHRYHGGLMI